MRGQMEEQIRSFSSTVQRLEEKQGKEMEALRMSHAEELQKVNDDILNQRLGEAEKALGEKWRIELNVLRQNMQTQIKLMNEEKTKLEQEFANERQ